MLPAFKKDWKKKLNPSLLSQLEELMEKTRKHEDAYRSSDNPQITKIWCALAELYTEIKFLELRLKRLEESGKKRKKPIEEELKHL